MLSIRLSTEGNKARVTVQNTGLTVSPEELPLLFDRFHKADKSRSADREGVGTGAVYCENPSSTATERTSPSPAKTASRPLPSPCPLGALRALKRGVHPCHMMNTTAGRTASRNTAPGYSYYNTGRKQKRHTGLIVVLVILAVLTGLASWACERAGGAGGIWDRASAVGDHRPERDAAAHHRRAGYDPSGGGATDHHRPHRYPHPDQSRPDHRRFAPERGEHPRRRGGRP